MRLRSCLLSLLIIAWLASCYGYKKVLTENLTDGTSIILIRPTKKLSEYRYLSAAHGKYNVMHDEYRINRFSCDSIIKLIFKKGDVTILYLTNEKISPYEVTKEDRLIYEKANPYIDSSNREYANFIKEAKGYRVHYSGKFHRKMKFN